MFLKYLVRRGNSYRSSFVRYNPNDVRHVIRNLGDRFTLASIANALGVSKPQVSVWCAGYATLHFPAAHYHYAIFRLANDVNTGRQTLETAAAPLHPRARH